MAKRFFPIIGFIFFGAASILLPHLPNFTAMNALALFGAIGLGSTAATLFGIFAILFLTNLFFGFYPELFFIYFSFGLTSLMGKKYLDREHRYKQAMPLLASSSFLFFVISNFGVWVTNSHAYPRTLEGLCICYLAALPFLANQLLGDLFYGFLLWTYGRYGLHGRYGLDGQNGLSHSP